MERTGIPASIKMAQALLESNAGQSTLAKDANNHFGIKCHSTWLGKKYYQIDDDTDPTTGKPIQSCFRHYKDAEESFKAHSEFLTDTKAGARYQFLFNLDPADYKGWARGLRRAGYATSPTYDDKLIDLIERLELYELDISGNSAPVAMNRGSEKFVNEIKVALSKNNESLAEVANRAQISLKRLMRFNDLEASVHQPDLVVAPTMVLPVNTVLYLQPKRNNYRGKQTWYYVKQGESMYYIAQTYGVKLSKLYAKNRMPAGTQPAMGQKIKIRGWKRPVRDVVLLSNGPVKPVIGVPGADLPMDNQTGDEQMNNGFDQPAPPPPALPKPTPDVLDNRGIDPRDLDKEIEAPTSSLPRPATTSNNTKVPTEVPGVKPTKPASDTPKNNTGTAVNRPATGGTSVPLNSDKNASFYTVLKGDTLYSISKKLGITLDKLKQLNQLKDNTIAVGQQLKIR